MGLAGRHFGVTGMEFCCGCWLEGGQISDASAYHPGFGNIYEALPAFIEEKKVNIVHFRNITSPLPAFDETFIDDGESNIESPCPCRLSQWIDCRQVVFCLHCDDNYHDCSLGMQDMVICMR